MKSRLVGKWRAREPVVMERKKSDFRQPSTRFGEMKSRPDRGRIEGHWSYRAIAIYRRVAFVSKANKTGEGNLIPHEGMKACQCVEEAELKHRT